MSNGTVNLPEITVTPTTAGGGLIGQTVSVQQSSNPAPMQLNASGDVPDDVATLIVNGMEFDDWESVNIHVDYFSSQSEFRFTAAERDFPAGALKQFGPGDSVAIYLGNQLVIDGFLELRQIAYDGYRHHVELRGVNDTGPVMRSSVHTESGSFDGMPWQEVATKVLSAYDIGLKVVGTLNPIPFVRLQAQPGEMVWDFLERLARPRGIRLGNDAFSNVLAVGLYDGEPYDALIEGQNIKRCQAIFHQEHSFAQIETIGQVAAGSTGVMGTDASEQFAYAPGPGYYPSSTNIVPSEQPVLGKGELQDRANWEATWQKSDQTRVFITVVGWYRTPKILLWAPLQEIIVSSPMIPMNSVMTIQNVTFKQDSSNGTETEIELKFPWASGSSTPVGPITGPSTSSGPATNGQPPGQLTPDQIIQPIPD